MIIIPALPRCRYLIYCIATAGICHTIEVNFPREIHWFPGYSKIYPAGEGALSSSGYALISTYFPERHQHLRFELFIHESFW